MTLILCAAMLILGNLMGIVFYNLTLISIGMVISNMGRCIFLIDPSNGHFSDNFGDLLE